MKPSQRYSRDADVMMKFRNAYVELTNSATPRQNEYLITVLAPSAGTPGNRWTELRRAVAQAAGAAALVYSRHGRAFTVRRGVRVIARVSPVADWEMSLRDPEQLPPETVISSVEAAIAAAQHHATEAADRERGLVGLVAAFIRWPTELREAAGPGVAQRTAAGAIGYFGQVMVATVGGALAAAVVAGTVALWKLVV